MTSGPSHGKFCSGTSTDGASPGIQAPNACLTQHKHRSFGMQAYLCVVPLEFASFFGFGLDSLWAMRQAIDVLFQCNDVWASLSVAVN